MRNLLLCNVLVILLFGACLRLGAPALPVAQSMPVAAASMASTEPVIGYGAQTQGGEGGRIITVSTADGLRAAIAATGARVVTLAPSTGLIDLMRAEYTGQKTGDINVTAPFLTIDGSQAPNAQIKGGMFIVKSHDVIFRNLRIRPGDNVASPDDADPISLNGMTSETYNIVIDHCSLSWGPDMGAISILNNVHDVTVQNSILGPGLYLSRHSEATAGSGHSMSTSVFFLDSGAQKVAPKNITFVHNLFTTADRRMPVVYGDNIEIVNNVVYNWKRRPAGGNPRSVNFVNNYVKAGPETDLKVAWSPQPHADAQFGSYIAGSVYEAGTVTDGFTTVRGDPQSVYRGDSQPWAMTGVSLTTQSAAAAYSAVLSASGAQPRDSIDSRLIADVQNRTGPFPNASDLSWETTAGATPTAGPTATGIPPTPTPEPQWIPLMCSTGTIEIEKVTATTARWRCVE